MGHLGCRRSGYGSSEVYILIKGAIRGSSRDWTLEGFPGVQGDVHSLFPEQNKPFSIATLMNILFGLI